MKLKNFSLCLLAILNLSAALPTSAVRFFLDASGNQFTTSGQGQSILSINTAGVPLTEDMFNHISDQAQKDGYQQILLTDSTLLDQNAAKKLALNFLTVGYDSFYTSQSVIFNDKNIFKGGATVLDVKRFISEKILANVYSYLVQPYLILPADNLVSSLIIDVYVKGDCLSENGYDNGKILECEEYYHTCNRIPPIK